MSFDHHHCLVAHCPDPALCARLEWHFHSGLHDRWLNDPEFRENFTRHLEERKRKPIPVLKPGEKWLTVATPTYADPAGLYFTLRSLREHHGWDFNIVVVDTAPERHPRIERLTESAGGAYHYRPDRNGTSPAKQTCFEISITPWVMVCDSHVLFGPGAIARLIELSQRPEHSRDLLTGPLVYDNGDVATHWRPHLPPILTGQWVRDERVDLGEPFEIPMQGTGCFAMSRAAWVGCHPLARGFGAEEGYLHEKVRRGGGRNICIPQLRWSHWFRDPESSKPTNPTPYPLHIADTVFCLLVQHRELGIDAEAAIHEHYGSLLSKREWQNVLEEAKIRQPFNVNAKRPLPCKSLGPIVRRENCNCRRSDSHRCLKGHGVVRQAVECEVCVNDYEPQVEE